MTHELTHEIHLQYSQNGHVISDEMFRAVPFFWKRTDEEDARARAKEIAREYRCGMVDVYVLSPQGNRTGIYSAYGMDQLPVEDDIERARR